MDLQCERSMRDSLIWLPEKGYGYFPVTAGIAPYDRAYWDEYVRRGRSDIGNRLNEFRVGLVNKYTTGTVLDLGIGAGSFIEARAATGFTTVGYDVNPVGIEWLKGRGLWCDWREQDALPDVTMWDVLEHLDKPHELLDKISGFVFVSIPVFNGPQHAIRSKHYKKNEHALYFTRQGFISWMAEYGFVLIEETGMECTLGRQDVHTFALKKVRTRRPL